MADGPGREPEDESDAASDRFYERIHDLNNLLAVIAGHAELGLRDADDASRRRLDEIVKAARSGARLTRELLAERPR